MPSLFFLASDVRGGGGKSDAPKKSSSYVARWNRDRRGKSKEGRRDYYIVFDRACGDRDGEGYSRSGTPFPYVVLSNVCPATPELNLKTVLEISVLFCLIGFCSKLVLPLA